MPPAISASTTARMLHAHRHGAAQLGVVNGPIRSWGWAGRTVSGTATAANGAAWLRTAAATDTSTVYWSGNVDAATLLPAEVPRPRLRAWTEWTTDPWSYRSELHDLSASPALATEAAIRYELDLPDHWWTATQHAMEKIAAVSTHRYTIEPSWLAKLLHRALGITVDPQRLRWATAHGDFHPANLCGPVLQILDWEGWGLAPVGYDAATLHTYCLAAPATAIQVRAHLQPMLETPEGQIAELTTIAEAMLTTRLGAHPHLLPSLRRRATALLERRISGGPGQR